MCLPTRTEFTICSDHRAIWDTPVVNTVLIKRCITHSLRIHSYLALLSWVRLFMKSILRWNKVKSMFTIHADKTTVIL